MRQAVFVARELEPAAAALCEALDLDEPFRDPGVREFGLQNVVFALGDCFLEIVSPISDGTAAGRYLDRHGDGGYMALFDLEDLDAARERAHDAGVRVVWQIDLPDISGTHLHPADMRGAIVSLDCSRPYGTWRWGGPQWTGRTARGAAGALRGITLAVPDAEDVAARWGRILAVGLDDGTRPSLRLDGGAIEFVETSDEMGEGLIEIALDLPPQVRDGRDSLDLGGVRLRLGEL